MKNISFKDVLFILDEPSLNEISLLNTNMDRKVKDVLWKLGININDGYEVKAYKHRTMRNEVHVGYMYCGVIRCDEGFKDSRFCTAIDRIAIAGMRDVSLGSELYRMSTGSTDFEKLSNNSLDTSEGLADFYEEDYLETQNLLDKLNAIAYNVRGKAHKENGSLKSYRDYVKD